MAAPRLPVLLGGGLVGILILGLAISSTGSDPEAVVGVVPQVMGQGEAVEPGAEQGAMGMPRQLAAARRNPETSRDATQSGDRPAAGVLAMDGPEPSTKATSSSLAASPRHSLAQRHEAIGAAMGWSPGDPRIHQLQVWFEERSSTERELLPALQDARPESIASFNQAADLQTARLIQDFGERDARVLARRLGLRRADSITGELFRVDLDGQRLPPIQD